MTLEEHIKERFDESDYPYDFDTGSELCNLIAAIAREFAAEELKAIHGKANDLYMSSLARHGGNYGHPDVDEMNEVGRILQDAIASLTDQK